MGMRWEIKDGNLIITVWIEGEGEYEIIIPCAEIVAAAK